MCELNAYTIVDSVFKNSGYGQCAPCKNCPWLRRMRMKIGINIANCTLQEYHRSADECRGFDSAAERIVRNIA